MPSADDPRIERGVHRVDPKTVGLMLMDLVDDIAAGRVIASELCFSPAKLPAQRTASAQGNWVLTLKGKGSGKPAETGEVVEEFSGSLF